MGSGLRFRLSLVGSIVAAVVVEFDPHLAWVVIIICEGMVLTGAGVAKWAMVVAEERGRWSVSSW